jgi:putative tricarboxylic transport membrane protein
VRNRDLLFGITTLVVAVVYYRFAVAIPESDLADPVGPQGLPRVYALLLAALSLILIARSLRSGQPAMPNAERRMPEPAESRIPDPRSRPLRIIGMLLIGVAYIIVLPWLGYLVSVAALITATIYFQGGVINGRSILVAVSGAVCLWLLFIWLLRIQYPAGLWPSVI